MMISIEMPSYEVLTEVKQWPTWEKEPCEFNEDYTRKEKFYILEGAGELSTECGMVKPFSAGDFITVEAGVLVTWKITESVKKHFKYF